jgi:hypothetical protein
MKSSRFIAPLSAALLLLSASTAFAAGPSISTVLYGSVTANVPTSLSVTVGSASGVKSCNLYVDSEDIGSMTVNGNTATIQYTFPRGGVFTAFAFCRDYAGGMASGANTSIFAQGVIIQTPSFGGGSSSDGSQETLAPVVTNPTPTSTTIIPPSLANVSARSLIKLECADGATADDPCKAVYFYGRDGKRHAFPNDKAYFTWYQNFDSVTTVTPDQLSAMPLGKNITYRPGIRMVKFQTLNHVYAVGSDGVLRWVATEDVARALYGDDWNTKIDDIPDAFYTNYIFGTDIVDATTFSPSAASAAAVEISS